MTSLNDSLFGGAFGYRGGYSDRDALGAWQGMDPGWLAQQQAAQQSAMDYYAYPTEAPTKKQLEAAMRSYCERRHGDQRKAVACEAVRIGDFAVEWWPSMAGKKKPFPPGHVIPVTKAQPHELYMLGFRKLIGRLYWSMK